MFQLRYAANELRRRLARTLLTALGLAAGVGLVIGIIGVSQGLDESEREVLAPLTSIGTDILVTRVAGNQQQGQVSPAPSAAPNQQGGRGAGQGAGPGGAFFGIGGAPGGGGNTLNQADQAALIQENASVLTDLSKLGKPGEKFTRDLFLSGTFISFPEEATKQIASVPGVTSAVSGLTLLASHQTGTVPQQYAELQTGGQTFTQTVRPEPLSEEERAAVQTCMQEQAGSAGSATPRPRPSASPPPSVGLGTTPTQAGPGGGAGRREFERCLPQRFQEFRAQFIVPLQTIRQAVNPPSTDISSNSYTAAGIDPSNPHAGLVTTKQLGEGRWFAKDAPNEVLLNVAYANKTNLKVGSQIPINGTTFTAVGLVSPTLTGNTADIYFQLATLQTLAGKTGRVTQILVQASDASSVDKVSGGIKKVLPGAEVVTTKSLADQVTGSLSDAQKLAGRLGGALAAIVLAAAFAIAVLLTLSSIAKRVREIGTLRAIGWSKRKVVGQVLAETVGIGVVGGLLGIAVGAATSLAIGRFSPPLTATSTGVPGMAGSSFSGLFGQATQAVAKTTTIELHAPLHPTTLALGVAFAVVGGLLAGVIGGWRAARLAPAQALSNLG